MRALAQIPGQTLPCTAVPPGRGIRIGVDRDEDGVLNGDDNCHANDNPDRTNSDSAGNPRDPDDDNDELSDTFESGIGSNALLTGCDGDGDINQDTPGQDTNPLLADGDGLDDAADPIPLTVNIGDGDLAPWDAPDGQINAADLLIAQQIVLGPRTVT